MNGQLNIAASESIIDTIVTQHAEETCFLWDQRGIVVCAPHISLDQLARHDDRLAAHIDGLRVAGEASLQACEAQLALDDPGSMFAAMVLALENKHIARIEMIFSLGENLPLMQGGLISAFGWISAQFLQGTARGLLLASSPFRRRVGLACCAMHQVDPGAALDAAVVDADTSLRARGLRVAGQGGRRDLLAACVKALADEDAACRFWAAYSAVLLGDRGKAIDVLKELTLQAGPFRARALRLVLKLLGATQSRLLLKTLASDPANIRFLIQGAGIAGDPHYVTWLIKQMEDPKLSRLAGESFSFITGFDLACLDLDGKPPENFESGPNDNPDDPDVSMDPDDSLPWPDPGKIKVWWDANTSRFSEGVRHFMGEPVNLQNCRQVLREGYQRQRVAAAEYLCLLQPGTHLFPTSAPAWRQERWLGKMG